MMRLWILLPAPLLAGCFGREAKTEVVEVRVPVAVPCLGKAPDRPVYRFGTDGWPGEKQAALLLTGDLEAAKQYDASWEAAAAGCLVLQPRKP